jgi:hypothetical protein
VTALAVLLDVRSRLSSPKSWLKGAAIGLRLPSGSVRYGAANADCWCLGAAISLAVTAVASSAAYGGPVWTELRSDVERELLSELDRLRGEGPALVRFAVIHQWNDRAETRHEDVLTLLDSTLARLEVSA